MLNQTIIVGRLTSDLEVKEMQKTLQKSEIRFKRIIETSIEGILVFDKEYKITFSNNKMATMLGYSLDEMLGRTYLSFFPNDQLDIYDEQNALRKRGESSVYEVKLKSKDNKNHWFLVSASAILNDDGEFEGSFAMLTDITKRKEVELLLEESNRKLTELSNTDSITGIANRRCFDTTLEHEYNRLSRSKLQLSVIMFDIDHFKEYNDYYGHVMGDECLRQIGAVLSSCISRSVDLAARYGGDEFACILPDTDLKDALKIAEKIRKSINSLKIEHKKSIVANYLTISMGVLTVNYSSVKSITEIIDSVDKLLYKAKDAGRNRIEYGELN